MVLDATDAYVPPGQSAGIICDGTQYQALVGTNVIGEWTGVEMGESVQIGIGRSDDEGPYPKVSRYDNVSLSLLSDPPTVSDIPDVEIEKGGFDNSIDLDDYIDDDYTDPANITWSVESTSDIEVTVDPATHRVRIVPDSDFAGVRTFTFIAEDEEHLADSDDVTVTVPDVVETIFTDISVPSGMEDEVEGRAVTLAGLVFEGTSEALVANGSGERAFLYRSVGGATFESVASAAGLDSMTSALCIVAADYDNDGDLDYFLGTSDAQDILYENNGDGTYTDGAVAKGMIEDGTSSGAAWVDFDGDGWIDLLVARPDGGMLVYWNDSGNGFWEVSFDTGLNAATGGTNVLVSDLDGDSDMDLYLVRETGSNILFENEGGWFTENSQAGIDEFRPSGGALAGDFNNDLWMDVFVANIGDGTESRNTLYLSQGYDENIESVSFEDVTAMAGIGGASKSNACCALDFDNDGWLDIFVANGDGQNELYRNDGDANEDGSWDGHFSVVSATSGCQGNFDGTSRGCAAADADRDGDPDLYVTDARGFSDGLYRNNVGQESHWLQVDLVGAISNLSAIGAQVELYEYGTPWQVREISGGTGTGSQDQLTAEFGLGDVVWTDLVIRWPSGIEQTLTNVFADQVLTVTEEEQLIDIELTPDVCELCPGATEQLTAIGHFNSGVSREITTEVAWFIVDERVADLSTAGEVLGLREGRTEVYACKDDVVSHSVLIDVAEARLWYLDILPATRSALVGEPLRYTLSAVYKDVYDETQAYDVSSEAIWEASDTSVVSFYGGGLGIAGQTGQTTICAWYDGLVSPIASLNVYQQEEAILALSPSALSLSYMSDNQLSAYREYPGGASDEVSSLVTWSSDDETIVSVFDLGFILSEGPNVGTAVITASSGEMSATAEVTVYDDIPPQVVNSVPAPGIRDHFTSILFNLSDNHDVAEASTEITLNGLPLTDWVMSVPGQNQVALTGPEQDGVYEFNVRAHDESKKASDWRLFIITDPTNTPVNTSTPTPTVTPAITSVPPVIADIPDFRFLTGSDSLAGFELDDYVHDYDHDDMELSWTHSTTIPYTPVAPSISILSRQLNIGASSVVTSGKTEWKVTDPTLMSATDDSAIKYSSFQLNGPNLHNDNNLHPMDDVPYTVVLESDRATATSGLKELLSSPVDADFSLTIADATGNYLAGSGANTVSHDGLSLVLNQDGTLSVQGQTDFKGLYRVGVKASLGGTPENWDGMELWVSSARFPNSNDPTTLARLDLFGNFEVPTAGSLPTTLKAMRQLPDAENSRWAAIVKRGNAAAEIIDAAQVPDSDWATSGKALKLTLTGPSDGVQVVSSLFNDIAPGETLTFAANITTNAQEGQGVGNLCMFAGNDHIDSNYTGVVLQNGRDREDGTFGQQMPYGNSAGWRTIKVSFTADELGASIADGDGEVNFYEQGYRLNFTLTPPTNTEPAIQYPFTVYIDNVRFYRDVWEIEKAYGKTSAEVLVGLANDRELFDGSFENYASHGIQVLDGTGEVEIKDSSEFNHTYEHLATKSLEVYLNDPAGRTGTYTQSLYYACVLNSSTKTGGGDYHGEGLCAISGWYKTDASDVKSLPGVMVCLADVAEWKNVAFVDMGYVGAPMREDGWKQFYCSSTWVGDLLRVYAMFVVRAGDVWTQDIALRSYWGSYATLGDNPGYEGDAHVYFDDIRIHRYNDEVIYFDQSVFGNQSGE